jgi:hypothetical protein
MGLGDPDSFIRLLIRFEKQRRELEAVSEQYRRVSRPK